MTKATKPKHQKRRHMPIKGLPTSAILRKKSLDQRKLALLRRADTERDVKHSISGDRKKATFGKPAPITLARTSILDHPDDEKLPPGTTEVRVKYSAVDPLTGEKQEVTEVIRTDES